MRFLITTWAIFSVSFLSAQRVSKFDRADLEKVPAAPDYSNLDYWIAHPEVQDFADYVPGHGEIADRQGEAKVDVFFIYPTIYTKKQKRTNPWNADVNDHALNQRISESTIKNQATVFNGSARVFAPLYRQAHYNVFKTKDVELKQKALAIAYGDVEKAFIYFIENFYNNGPLIIASHSQGTLHAERLIKTHVDGKQLHEQLVAAYLIGMPLDTNTFHAISPCCNKNDTGCWISWNTYAKGYYPRSFEKRYAQTLSTNPLNWEIGDAYVAASKNLGGVLRNFRKIRPAVNDAQNHRGVLWISKPKFFGNFLMFWKRYHIADYNLFYMNIRANVENRVAQYFSQKD